MTDPTLAARKSALRLQARRTRDQAALDDDGRVVDLLSGWLATAPTDATLSGYLAIGSEVDVGPVLANWSQGSGAVALPCTGDAGSALVFRSWSPGDPLAEEAFGTRAPGEDAAVVEPDILLVPLLAFDREGYRIGWGGGFYDRTLAGLRKDRSVTAVGVAYAAQEVPRVPRAGWDQPLDLVVTERQVIHIG